MNLFRYAWAEIKNTKRFSLFFIFNLSLGLFGFLSLEFFKDSLQSAIRANSRAVLGADLGITARRLMTSREIQIVNKELGTLEYEKTQTTEVFSMAAHKDGRSTLVQIKVVASNFPFYGEIETEPAGLTTHSLNIDPVIWVYPELLQMLEVQIGDSMKLGDHEFKIAAIVKNDSASGISTSMAPRIYMSFPQFEKTKLMRPGSMAWQTTLYKLPSLDKNGLDDLRDSIFEKMPSADLQVNTHENASEQMGRLLAYLNDFLGLAAIVSLFICGLGIGFLCHSLLVSRIKSIAILRSLGLARGRALGVYAVQVGVLAAISSVLAGISSMLAVPLFQKTAQKLMNFPVDFSFKPLYLAVAFCSCILVGLLTLLPLLLKIRNVKPQQLLQDHITALPRWDLISLMGFLPLLTVFYALSVWQTYSWYNGTLFFLSFTGVCVIFYAVGFAVMPLLRWLPTPRWTALRWALRDLSRLRFSTLSCFLALAVSLLLLNLIPQVERSIREEIKNPPASRIPGLFLFDIQEEQLADLQALITDKKIELRDLSPMIRSRLTSVNGEAFDKGQGAKGGSREQEQEMRFRNRGFNLSYREELSASETIVKGRPFSKTPGAVAELSVEDRFAERLSLKIGDRLVFDIQSVPVEGEIVNLRKVQWTSFQPNFFVMFQPGFLEGAPKTYLATLPRLPQDEKVALQADIVRANPNISLIDVSRLVERLQQIVVHISAALKLMLLLTLSVGFVVLFSISSTQASLRKWDIGLLKALGAPLNTIRDSLLLQFFLIALFASTCGFALSLVVSYIISYLLFDNLWFFDAWTPAALLFGCVTVTGVITWISLKRSLNTEARQLLNRN